MLTKNPYDCFSFVDTEEQFLEQLQYIKLMHDASLTWNLFQVFLLKLQYYDDIFERLGNSFTLESLLEYYNFELSKYEFEKIHVSLFFKYLLKYGKQISEFQNTYSVRFKPNVDDYKLVYLVFKTLDL